MAANKDGIDILVETVTFLKFYKSLCKSKKPVESAEEITERMHRLQEIFPPNKGKHSETEEL